MATGTNGIATISDCNGIASAFTGGSTFNGTAQTSYSTISSSGSSVAVNTTGFKYVNSSYTYYKITATCPLKLNITIKNSLLRHSSPSGSIITNYSLITGGVIRVGLTTSSSSTSFSHYIDIVPTIGNNSSTVSSLDIPVGTWYVRANCTSAPFIYNPQTSSGSVTGNMYYGWQFTFTANVATAYCPTYSEINGTGKFSISGSYTTNQCVQYSHIKKKQGIINLTIGNSTSDSMGFYYTGNNKFSGSTYTEMDSFMSTKTVSGTWGSTYFISSSGSTGKWEVSMDPSWSAGYYYLINYASNGYYGVSEVYINSSQATTLNNGTNLTLTANYWTITQY